MIKLVSVDLLRTLQKPIDPKIHSVPALLIVNNSGKEYLFGKAVFDHLLLPNRGVLFSSQQTTIKKDNKPSAQIPENSGGQQIFTGEPQAFALGAISAEYFSSFDNNEDMINDKNYKWDLITNNNTITGNDNGLTGLDGIGMTGLVSAAPAPTAAITINKIDTTTSANEEKRLPSMEDIMKQRAMDVS